MTQIFHSIHSTLLAHSIWLWKMSGKLLLAVIIAVIFWLLGILIKRIILRLSKKTKQEHPGFRYIANFCKITITLVGLITALGTVGVDVSAIIAGLGLTGFAIGFALKDLLANILAGLTILIYQPYKIGDIITVPKASSSNIDFTGKVMAINLRYTVLSNTQHEKILIPNTSMTTNTIIVGMIN